MLRATFVRASWSSNSLRTVLQAALLGGCLIAASSSALAATTDTWTDGANPNISWGTSGNWTTTNGGGIPLTGDTLLFNSSPSSLNSDDNLGNAFSIATLNFATGAGSFNVTSDNGNNDQSLVITSSLIDQANGSIETINFAINSSTPAGTLFMGNTTATTPDTNGNATLILNANAAFTALTSSINNATGDTLQLGNNSTLTINGNIGVGNYNVSAGVSKLAIAGTTANTGSLTDNLTTAVLSVGDTPGASPGTGVTSVLDLSGLNSFTFTGLEVDVGGNLTGTNTGNRSIATLTLAGTSNTIKVTSTSNGVTVGGGSTSNGGTDILNLSGTGSNVIWTPALFIGTVKSNGTVQFSGAGSGTFTLRGATGGTSRATIDVGFHSGAGTAAAHGTLNLTGHSVDILGSTLTVGAITGATTGTGSISSSMSFDTGTVDVTSILLGQKATGAAATGVTGTLTMGGGTLTVNSSTGPGTGTFVLGSNGTSGAGTANGVFNLSAGIANINTNITMGTAGAGNSGTINFSGGTLNMGAGATATNFGVGTSASPITNFNMPTSGQIATIQNLGGGGIFANGGSGATPTDGSGHNVGGLTMGDAGTLILAGNNTYNGPTNANNGTLQFSSATPAVNSALTLNGGAVAFTPGIGTFNFGGLSGSNGLTLNDTGGVTGVTLKLTGTPTVAIPSLSSTNTYSGSLSGKGGLTLAGTNGTSVQILSGTNSYSGNTTISGGTLQLQGGQLYSGVGSPGTVTISGGTLAGDGTISTGVTMSSGTLAADTSGSPLNINSLTMNGGSLQFTLNSSTGSIVDVAGTATLSSGSFSFLPQNLPVAAGTYTMLNALNLTSSLPLTAQTVTGVTFIPSIGNSTTIPGDKSIFVQVINPNNLVWTGAHLTGSVANWDVATTQNWLNGATPSVYHQFDSVSFDDTASNFNVNIVGQTMTPGATSASVVNFTNSSAHSYVVTGLFGIGGPAGLTVNSNDGNGTVTLQTPNTYTGNTTVQAGTLIVSSSGTNVGSIASPNVNVNGAGALNGLGLVVGSGGTVSATTIGINNNGALNVNSGGTLAALTSGGIAVTVANSSGTGFTVASGGILSGTVNLVNNGTTTIGSSQAIATLNGTNPSAVLNQAGTLTVSGGGTYAGAINNSGSGALTVSGNTLILTGANNYTGNTTINSGATLQIDNGTSNTGSLSTTTAIANSGTLIIARSDSSLVVPNTIAGNGLTEVNGNPTGSNTSASVTFAGNNSGFTGTTAVYSGTLVQGSANALGAATVALQVGQPEPTPASGLNNLTPGNLTFAFNTVVGSFSALSAASAANPTPSVVTIPTGTTLTVNGAFLIGSPNTSPNSYFNATNFTGGGSLVVSGTGNFVVGQPSLNNPPGNKDTTTSDMSGLNSISVNTTGIFAVGYGSNSRGSLNFADTPNGAIAPSNTVNASELDVGNSLFDNNVGTCVLTLGQGTNVLQANTLNIGLGKTSGSITWSIDSSTTSSVNIGGTGGGSAVANIIVGGQNSATSGGGTSSLLLAGHTAVVHAGSLAIGENIGNTAGSGIANVTFDTGSFDTGAVAIGAYLSGTSIAGPQGTLIIGGNAVNNVNSGATGVFSVHGSVVLGEVTVATAPTTLGTATLAINGGTTNIGGTVSTTANVTSTLNLEAGILNMAGNGIGSSAASITNMNILDQGGSSVVLTNLGGGGIFASGGNAASNGGLMVPSAGSMLILDGNNTYLNGTTINGTLQLGQASSPALASPVGNASGTVTVNGNLNFASNSTMIVANSLTGGGTINQNGNGTTTLTGNSTFTGPVNISAGTLSVQGFLNHTGSPQNPITISGGNLAGAGTTGDDVTLNSGTITPDASANALSVNSLTTNGGTLQFNVSGGTIGHISSANFASLSNVQLSFGLLSAPTLSSYTILTSTSALQNVPTLTPFSAGRTTFTPSVSGGDNLIVSVSGGPATLTWNKTSGDGTSWDVQGQNNWTSTAPSNPNQFFQYDNVNFTDSKGASSYTVNLTTTVTPLSINVNTANTYTFNGSGAIAGSTGITLTGGGTLSLANTSPNSYAGTTTITNGTLQLASAVALPTGATVSLGSSGKLDLDGNTATLGSLSGSGTIGNSSTSTGATLNYAGLGSNTFSGAINDALGTGTKQTSLTVSSGSLILTANNGYTGNTVINSGTTLQIGNGSSSGSLSGSTAIANNGQLIYNLSSSPVIANNISGIGPVVQSGSGTVVLTGANSYGQTIINSGAVQIGNGTATGTPGLGNIVVNGNTVIFDRSDSPTFSSNISGTTGGVVKNIGGGTTTLTGAISGAVSLQQNSGGTLILPNNNTYTGGTTVTNGTLQVSGSGGASALGTGDVTVNASGILVGANGDAFGYDSGNTAGPPASPLNINVNGGTITDLGTATAGNYRITLPDLNFTGGTLTANAANLGDTNGQFSFQGQQTTGATPSTGPAIITTNAASTTVVFNAPKIAVQNPTIFNVAAGSVVSGPTPGVDLLISSQLIPYNGTAHSITKNGTGVMELSGVNSYTLSTIVNQGTLLLGVANSISTTSQVILNGGTLATGGFAQDFTTSAAPATLAVTATSQLDLGNAATVTNVKFAASNGVTWAGTLNINNWTFGTDHLFVGSNSSGLLPSQLSEIKFADFSQGASISNVTNSIVSPGEVTPLVGDINQDGHVDARDILALEQALTNPSGYATAHPSFTSSDISFILDVNGDGKDNNADLQGLINYLLAGHGQNAPVPEPASWLLLGLGGAALVARRARKKLNRRES